MIDKVEFRGIRYGLTDDYITKTYEDKLVIPFDVIKDEVGDIFSIDGEYLGKLEPALDKFLADRLEEKLGISGIMITNYYFERIMEEEIKKLKIKVIRKDGSIRDTEIMYDRNTDKYCFVNLTSSHVCKCRFNTPEEALIDLLKDDFVSKFEVTKYES